ncbi:MULTISPECIES: HNH endonuclease signature motif containing protein [unclassified Rathayibacter]|uniref:HNH endonuclease signature motif containing protein n=1 Tax=unclassified Rathayibacter TaxID=2609250 RepID=UPI0013574E71|nr:MULTISPECIES: HNH endonuclease signature motif containing protein [unclassified Rathayibacter]
MDARPPGGVSVRERFDDALVSAVGAACAVDAFLSQAQAQRYELVELARLAAVALPEALVDPSVQRHVEVMEAAQRALVAEIATGMRMTEADAAALIEESALLVNELPDTLTALREGRCTPQHVRVIVKAAWDVPAEVRERLDEEAAVLAVAFTAGQVRRRLRTVRERLHPESATARHRRCAERRGVWLGGEADGMATLHLHLPAPEAHGAFDRVDRAARALAAAPAEARTVGQLRADIAASLLLDGETSSDDEHRTTITSVPAGIRPRVSVTVPVLTLLGRSEEPGTLDGYGPIDPGTARRLAADAPSFTRILTHPESGAVLSVGRDSYRVPADLRRHLQHRDGTCRFPGCVRSAADSDVDHGIEWQNGGGTDVENLAHLCRHHHRLRHTTTWTLRHRPGGVLEWTSPTGRRHLTRPVEPEQPFAREGEPEGGREPKGGREMERDRPGAEGPPPF